MGTDADNYAPYAAPANVNEVLARLRQHGLPETITSADLTRLVGTHPNVAGRVLAALRFLDLVDDTGRQTEAMKRIKTASATDYPERLAEIIKTAYALVFDTCDPATATDEQLEDAFRFYTPTAQRSRMVTLFVGMCKAAGLCDGRQATRPGARVRVKASVKTEVPATSPSDEPKNVTQANLSDTDRARSSSNDYGLLQKFMDQLPFDGVWTQTRRDQWLAAVTATLDLLIEVVKEAKPNPTAIGNQSEEHG